MSFKVNPIREVKFHEKYEEEDGSVTEFSVTFNFIASEDIDYVELRKKMEDKQKMLVEAKEDGKVKLDKDGKPIITEIEVGTYNAFLYTLRTSLTNWEGIVDLEEKPLLVKDSSDKIIQSNQIAVFESLRYLPAQKGQPSIMDKITKAYIGQKGKNL